MRTESGDELRPVVGYEGLYFISEAGDVYGAHKGLHKRKAVRKPDGYMTILLWRDNKPKCVRIHRLVAEAFIGPVPSGEEVNHVDGNKGNNRKGNLEYVTRSRNMRHAMDRGMYPIGERHPYASLTEAEVVSIRARYAAGESVTALAKSLGIKRSCIHSVVYRLTWKRTLGGGARKPHIVGSEDSRAELVN